MTTIRSYLGQRTLVRSTFAETPMFLAILGVIALLLFRNGFAFGPNIFGDELTYSVLARASGRISALDVHLMGALPNHLYFDVYKQVADLGLAGLSAARAINVLFCGLAVVPLYWLVRRWRSPRVAALISALAVFACPGLYSSLYMPESMYVFFFYSGFALAVAALDDRWRSVPLMLALTVTLAGMSLTKPHGLVVAVAICMSSCLCWVKGDWRGNLRSSIGAITVFVMSIIIRQVYVRYSGDLASLQVGDNMGSYKALLDFVPRVFGSPGVLTSFLHVAFQNIGSSLPFVIPAFCFLLAQHDTRFYPGSRSLLLALVLWLALFLMVVVFTVLVAIGSGESLDRIHQRYYDHALVLLCVLSASGRVDSVSSRRIYVWLALLVGLIVTLRFFASFPIGSTNWVDHPLLFGIYHFPLVGKISLLTPFVAVLLLTRWPDRFYLQVLGFLGLPVLGTVLAMLVQLKESQAMRPADRIGLALELLATPDQKLFVLSAGGNDSVHRMAFFLGKNAEYRFFNPEDPVSLTTFLSALPADVRLVADKRLTIGYDWVPVAQLGGGYTEYERREKIEDQLSVGPDDVLVEMSSLSDGDILGFHTPEQWGAWMAASKGKISLPKMLSGNYTITVMARKLDSKVPGNAAIEVCGEVHQVQVSDVMSEFSFDVKCAIPGEAIEVLSPYLVSPHDLGLSEDARSLGLAISTIVITKK